MLPFPLGEGKWALASSSCISKSIVSPLGPLLFLGWTDRLGSEGQSMIGKTRKERENHHKAVLPGQSKIWNRNKYHINIDFQIYIWNPDHSPELLTHIFNFLLNSPIWMPNRHLTLYQSKMKITLAVSSIHICLQSMLSGWSPREVPSVALPTQASPRSRCYMVPSGISAAVITKPCLLACAVTALVPARLPVSRSTPWIHLLHPQ